MFCPNCGKADQEYNSFCRNCGEFIFDAQKARSQTLFGDDSKNKTGLPILKNYVLISVFFSGLGFLGSLSISIILLVLLYQNGNSLFNSTLVFGILFLYLQVSGIYYANKALRALLRHARENEKIKNSIKEIESPAEPDKKLPEADFENIVPASIVEDTTKDLIKNKTKKLS